MANAMYTGDEICAMGQKYYHSLAKICKRLEKQGYWREAENMMKQSAGEELFGIARRFHVSPAQILTANGLEAGTQVLPQAMHFLVPGA